jgi:hypothetical protein
MIFYHFIIAAYTLAAAPCYLGGDGTVHCMPLSRHGTVDRGSDHSSDMRRQQVLDDLKKRGLINLDGKPIMPVQK